MLFSEFFLIETIGDLYLEVDSLRNDRLNKNKYINPKTDKPWRANDRWKQLRAIVTHEVKVNGTDPKKIWITFSDVSKLGQRMKIGDSKSTPVGIFAFPVSMALDKKGDLPFADRPYMHVFKTIKPHFEVGTKGVPEDFNNLIKKSNINGNATSAQSSFLNELDILFSRFYNSVGHDGAYPATQKIYSNIMNYIYNFPYNLGGINATEIKNNIPKEKDINDKIKEMIEKANYFLGTKLFYKFKDVGDDLSAKVDPAYGKHLMDKLSKMDPSRKSDLQLNLLKLAKAAESGERLPYSELHDLFKHQQDEQGITDDKRIIDLLKDKEVSAKFDNLIDNVIKLVDTFKEKKDKNYDILPYAKKLKAVADKYNLDYKKAVDEYQASKTVKTSNQFLYRVSQNLARQYATNQGGGADWRMAWNKMGRELGISGFADTRYSGHVHNSEKTQGVFMDPRDIVLIATIIQQSHSDKNDPASDLWRSFMKLEMEGVVNIAEKDPHRINVKAKFLSQPMAAII